MTDKELMLIDAEDWFDSVGWEAYFDWRKADQLKDEYITDSDRWCTAPGEVVSWFALLIAEAI